MASKTNTKWPTSDLSRIGRGALALALEQRVALEPRLPAGLLDGLAADLDAFDGKRTAAVIASEALRAATRTQNAAARTALDFLSATRGAVARNGASAAERAAFGLSLRPNANKIATVVAGLDAFVDGATRFPDVARDCGLLPADLDQARALRTALSTADADQETRKQTRKAPTAERVALQRRIEKAVDAIAAAGAVAFLLDPGLVQRFRALIPASAKRSTRARTPAAPPA